MRSGPITCILASLALQGSTSRLSELNLSDMCHFISI